MGDFEDSLAEGYRQAGLALTPTPPKTDDILANLGAQRTRGAKARHQHKYDRAPAPSDLEQGDWHPRCRCGQVQRPETTRKARSSVRLGKDQERRIEKVYGPLKVGERGDAIDLLGHDFKWQSKATRGLIPRYLSSIDAWSGVQTRAWMRRPLRAMEPLHRDLRPLLIRSYVHVGLPVKDYIIVRSSDWAELHGGPTPLTELVCLTGHEFLALHGRDER